MFSSLLSLLLVIPLIAAIPVPLETEFVEHDEATHSVEKAKFDEALGVANTQIANMKNVLDNHPDDPRIVQAFGPNANLDTIRSNVDRLASGTLKVHTSDPNFADREVAQIAKANAIAQGRDASQMPDSRPVNGYVPVNKSGGDVQMDAARFGSTFYTGTGEDNAKVRAGTIIHEATHQLSRTGDHVGNTADPNKIIRAGMSTAPNTRQNEGYAEAPIPNSDAAMGERYTALREASPNMEHNADSYRVFGALCSRSLYKRALTQEDPIGYYLAKRQQCSLPPDYFKKKAEAKASAASEATASPASAKEKSAANTKAVSKGASTTKGLKNAKTTKARKGIKATRARKGTKATRAGKRIKATRAGKGVKSTRKSLTKGTKATKGGRAAKGTKALRAAKGARGAKAAKGRKATKGAKGLNTTKGRKGTKATRVGKAGKSAKAVKGAKALRGAKAGKTLRSPKAGKGTKGSKVVKGGKAGKASKVSKVSRGAKVAKGAKALKSSRGAKVSKAGKGSKGVRAAKVGKVAKGGKGVAAKTPKGVKATKGKATASRASGRKATTSRASNKAAARGNTAKTTKAAAARSNQKSTKAAPRAVTKTASKAAPRVAAKASVPKKAGKKN